MLVLGSHLSARTPTAAGYVLLPLLLMELSRVGFFQKMQPQSVLPSQRGREEGFLLLLLLLQQHGAVRAAGEQTVDPRDEEETTAAAAAPEVPLTASSPLVPGLQRRHAACVCLRACVRALKVSAATARLRRSNTAELRRPASVSLAVNGRRAKLTG